MFHKPQLIRLETIVPAAPGGRDPRWLAEMFPLRLQISGIDLTSTPDRWPRIANWPNFDPARRAKHFGIAWFPNVGLRNFDEATELLAKARFGPEKRTFLPDLADQVTPRIDWIWAWSQREGKGPTSIFASSDEAYYQGDSGLCMPYIIVANRVYPWLSAHRVDHEFSDRCGFLVLLD